MILNHSNARSRPKLFPIKQFSKYCITPFVSIAVDTKGEVSLCGCTGWMPTTIGNLFESSLTDLLSSQLSVDIRQSVIDGTYQYCNEKTCGVIRNDLLNSYDTLPKQVQWQLEDPQRFVIPQEIWLAGDLTCNLSCPSCRTVVIKNSQEFNSVQEKLGVTLKQTLLTTPTSQPINITLSTSGELFASPMLLRFVSSIRKDDFPNLTLCIQTNGLLAPDNWHKLNELQHSVKKIMVTVDSPQPSTYEKLRRGGKWKDIVRALEWFEQQKNHSSMLFHTRMVVQRDNINQLEEFYYFSKKFNVDAVEYARITDWNTYSSQEFDDIDVLNPTHPQYQHAKNQLDLVCRHSDVLSWG